MPNPSGTRKGMGWVITNFPLKWKASCDATFYHSSLVLNITRPDRSSFCFKITSKLPESSQIKYSCQQPPSAGQVGRVQVLTAPGCGNAVAAVTVDGRPWTNYTYENDTNILSIDRIATVPPPDAANPADHTVCVVLRPIPIPTAGGNGTTTTCGSVTSFCSPSYGPDPACAVLVADNKGVCCPVNRISYADAELEGGQLYKLYGKFVAGCESITSESDLQDSIATQYRLALGLTYNSIQFLDYSCRASRMTAVFSATRLTLDTPDLIAQRSAVLLKPLATLLGLVGVRAVPYTAPPPPPLPQPPLNPASPQPPQSPSSPPPSHPHVPARASPPPGEQPVPPSYGSQPPPRYSSPVYGAY